MTLLHTADWNDPAQLGGKARALAELGAAGLPVPDWFVVPAAAFWESLDPLQREALETAATGAELAALLHELQPTARLCAEIAAALHRLCPDGAAVAVRSSAHDEDGTRRSFAGQFASYLFVPHNEVPAALVAVWRSAFSTQLAAYRASATANQVQTDRQLVTLPAPRAVVSIPAVLVQPMVDADAAGVAFSADPLTGRRGVALVDAVYGLGSGLVSGELDADSFAVDRHATIISRRIARKPVALRRDPAGGVRSVGVPESAQQQAALSDTQVLAVAELARRCEQFAGRPQDIEWAIAGGELFLLQSRPITTLAQLPDPDGAPALWDNSNIAESYGGVTTPLTFSFARTAYAAVYRQFCRLLGVPEQRIAAHAGSFERLIGLLRGRVYYNLLSWYQILALLPGYRINQGFMEQMMGVKQGLPAHLRPAIAPAHSAAKLRDLLELASSLLGLVRSGLELPTRQRAFLQRLQRLLGAGPQLQQLRPDELVAHYRALERELLANWDAPLINDFFAMIWYGLLRKLAGRWCGSADLANDLLCGEGGMISAEPARRVRELAELARAAGPALVDALCEGSLAQIQARISTAPAFAEQYQAYLQRFAERCMDELKLESATLEDDPLPLLRATGLLARHGASAAAQQPARQLRERAEQRVSQALSGKPLKNWWFGLVLRQARARVRERENLRFERTRVFGRARRLFLELGRRLAALDVLDDPRDVFYLEVAELLGYVEGSASSADLRGLSKLRKAEFEGYQQSAAPEQRLETRGIVPLGLLARPPAVEHTEQPAPALIQGIGCCPGLVRGRARLIHAPRDARLAPGEILVAERTDPGWIMLFASAGAVLVERGSLLSHSAIVARELGIPAVVAAAGAMQHLRDGEWIELDGSSGRVRRIEALE